MPQQYSDSRSPERGAALKAPRSAQTKDSGGAGAETPTAPSPYQEAKGGPPGLELGWHHEAFARSRPNGLGTGALFFPVNLNKPRISDEKYAKHLILGAILLALLVVLFPIRVIYKDGSSVGYRSILGLYEVRDRHQKMPLPEGGVKEGWSIEIAGKEIYNSTYVTK